ncbi:MAG: sensor histidine kinase, partial [Balneolaceae bacterium]|nr:sensor histidine kinase [Balneolaceae bacterium]
QLRTRSIAMIHEKLYQSDSLYDIDFDEYLQELVQTIQKTYSHVNQEIETVYDLDHVLLDINQVIPCSLVVNEVVVNCFKHAFSKNDKGTVKISLHYDDPRLTLRIADNGKGLPDDFKIEELQSLGMTLIQTLTDQLNGKAEFSMAENGGTVFQLEFDRKTAQL